MPEHADIAPGSCDKGCVIPLLQDQPLQEDGLDEQVKVKIQELMESGLCPDGSPSL